MKVEYIECDICGRKITPLEEKYKYRNVTHIPDPLDPLRSLAMNEEMDICNSCFGEMRAWIKERKEAKNNAEHSS